MAQHELKETEAVLAAVAPELAVHVHRFLHGVSGDVLRSGTLPCPHDYSAASIRLRLLHDLFSEAILRRDDDYKVAVLCCAVRLQAVVLYEAMGRHYHDS